MIERIVLHAGTPKTGTTSLQIALSTQRQILSRRGIFVPPTVEQEYPTPDGRMGVKPKHQFLVTAMMASDGQVLRVGLEDALRTAPPDAHTAVLSTEGLYHHWWDFTDAAKDSLRALTRTYRVEVWTWFRPPVEFFVSNYIQMLKNPITRVACYGRDWSPDRMLDDPWFAQRLDYAGFARDVSALLGPDALHLFSWRGRTVDDFFSHLGHPALGQSELREHATLGTVGVQMLRLVNARVVPNPTKAKALRLINQLDATLGPASPPFDPGPGARQRVEDLTQVGLEWLHRHHGLELRSIP